MDRRKFLQQVALWSAGIIVMPPVFRITPDLFAGIISSPKLVVAEGKNYTTLVVKALEPFGGIAAFVKQGDKVVVKPNIGWDRNPAQAANTHPLIVSSLCSLALDAGASEVKVFDRTCNEERRSYNNSGILSALEKIKDKRLNCTYIDRRKFVPIQIDNGRSLKEWEFYKDALEADCYINVPIAKHHSLAGLTLGLKNIMGVIGGMRGIIHQDMGQNLADLNTVITPNLTVIDATRILLRNGPSGGRLKDVKVMDTVIVTADPVAADAYATTLFDMKPDAIDSTKAAYKMGMGEMDPAKMDIIRL
ncbi:MAG: DUF362 domain-containing protein [Desulfobacterales bacterium]|nr:DUF362 domain-containing protein [Desulfobacterales bacterium]